MSTLTLTTAKAYIDAREAVIKAETPANVRRLMEAADDAARHSLTESDRLYYEKNRDEAKQQLERMEAARG